MGAALVGRTWEVDNGDGAGRGKRGELTKRVGCDHSSISRVTPTRVTLKLRVELRSKHREVF